MEYTLAVSSCGSQQLAEENLIYFLATLQCWQVHIGVKSNVLPANTFSTFATSTCRGLTQLVLSGQQALVGYWSPKLPAPPHHAASSSRSLPLTPDPSQPRMSLSSETYRLAFLPVFFWPSLLNSATAYCYRSWEYDFAITPCHCSREIFFQEADPIRGRWIE